MKKVGEYFHLEDSNRLFGSQLEVAKFIKGLLLKDYKIYEIQQNQGDLIPYHSHAHEEMILMIDGVMRLIIEEEIVDIQAGDLLTIKPWSIHLASFPFDLGAKFYLCYLKKSFKR